MIFNCCIAVPDTVEEKQGTRQSSFQARAREEEPSFVAVHSFPKPPQLRLCRWHAEGVVTSHCKLSLCCLSHAGGRA